VREGDAILSGGGYEVCRRKGGDFVGVLTWKFVLTFLLEFLSLEVSNHSFFTIFVHQLRY